MLPPLTVRLYSRCTPPTGPSNVTVPGVVTTSNCVLFTLPAKVMFPPVDVSVAFWSA